jgi:hypothetical protein
VLSVDRPLRDACHQRPIEIEKAAYIITPESDLDDDA